MIPLCQDALISLESPQVGSVNLGTSEIQVSPPSGRRAVQQLEVLGTEDHCIELAHNLRGSRGKSIELDELGYRWSFISRCGAVRVAFEQHLHVQVTGLAADPTFHPRKKQPILNSSPAHE